MVDLNKNDVYKKLAELPLRRYAEVLRNKAQDLTSMLGAPAYFDQYPSKRVPWIFSRTYGPIGLTATRNYEEIFYSGTATSGGPTSLSDLAANWDFNAFKGCVVSITAGTGSGQTATIQSNNNTSLVIVGFWAIVPDNTSVFQILPNGFNQLAPVVNPNEYLLPREGTIKTGREAAFVWCSSNAFAYLSWTYKSNPGFDVTTFPSTGDIFDPVIPMNGGAVYLPNIANANFSSPRVCFEMALYDKKRGRYLTDGRLPAEAFVGGAFANKLTPKQTRWNVDTEIEPRITVTEVNMGPTLECFQAYEAAQVSAYINVAFIGYNILEEKFNETGSFAAAKSGG